MNNIGPQIHKMVIKQNVAKTLCGLNIVAFYPMHMYAMTDVAGQANVKVTLEKGVTCEACKKKVKE